MSEAYASRFGVVFHYITTGSAEHCMFCGGLTGMRLNVNPGFGATFVICESCANPIRRTIAAWQGAYVPANDPQE